MKQTEAIKCMALLTAAYPRTEVPASSRNLFVLELTKIDAKVAREAIGRLVRTSKWFPALSELLHECAQGIAGELPEWPEAWLELRSAAMRFGRNRTPQFSNPLLADVVERYGWGRICGMSDEFVRRDLQDFYESRRDAEARELVNSPERMALYVKSEPTPLEIEGRRGDDSGADGDGDFVDVGSLGARFKQISGVIGRTNEALDAESKVNDGD